MCHPRGYLSHQWHRPQAGTVQALLQGLQRRKAWERGCSIWFRKPRQAPEQILRDGGELWVGWAGLGQETAKCSMPYPSPLGLWSRAQH